VFDFGATPMSSITAPVDVMVSGPDPEILDGLAAQIAGRLGKGRGLTTVTRSWTRDKRQLLLNVDVDKAIRYGVGPVEISRHVSDALKGGSASVLRVPGEDGYLIRVRYSEKYRSRLSAVEAVQISTPSGPVPLSELAAVRKSYTRTRFTRQDLQPTVDVYGYRATTAISHLQEIIEAALRNLPLPPGYHISHEGEIKNMTEAGTRLGSALLLAVILLFFSLAPTFESWTNPLTIMSAISLAMIGASWGLLISGQHACMPACRQTWE